MLSTLAVLVPVTLTALAGWAAYLFLENDNLSYARDAAAQEVQPVTGPVLEGLPLELPWIRPAQGQEDFSREDQGSARAQAVFALPEPTALAALPEILGMDWPMGNERGALTYDAQPFGENYHLGSDLNGIGGENSDLGDPIYAIADGLVVYAEDAGGGWGNLIAVAHPVEASTGGGAGRDYLQTFYAHLDEIQVSPGQRVRRGEVIGTVGTARGQYWAHLHLELRDCLNAFIGSGYRDDAPSLWLDPLKTLKQRAGWDDLPPAQAGGPEAAQSVLGEVGGEE